MIMLLDDEEIQIMAKAIQPHLREPKRSEMVSRRIFEDFLVERKLAGTKVLELGPGQYDLARMVEAAGATVVSMDHDPAVIALGEKRGYQVIRADFRRFDWSSLRGKFDGLTCRGSITPLWFRNVESLGRFVDEICSVLRRDGWGWLAPWNLRLSEAPPARARLMLEAEDGAFARNGFDAIDPTMEIAARYSLGRCPRLYLKGLALPGAA
jgi:SAM-dependent methyltransferase